MIGRVTVFAALLVLVYPHGETYAATLRIAPNWVDTSAATGLASAELRVDDPTAIAIYRVGIGYDGVILDVTADMGGSLPIDPPSCAFAVNDSIDGKLCIYITCFPALAEPDAVLAVLHLTGNVSGISPLAFDETGCNDQEAPNGCFTGDESETSLPCTTLGGNVSVHPTYTPTLTGTATPAHTSIPTETPTMTPSASPTPATKAELVPPAIGALPGGIACLGLRLAVGAATVASTHSVIDLGSMTPLTIASCSINPAIGPQSTYGKQITSFVPQLHHQEVDVGGSVVPLPDTVVFSCTAEVSPSAVAGTYPIGNETSVFDPGQNAIPGVLVGVSEVKVTSCSGDCDGDGSVSIADVQRCVGNFLGQSLCSPATAESSCPAADANHDGRVSMSETSECVNHFLGGC